MKIIKNIFYISPMLLASVSFQCNSTNNTVVRAAVDKDSTIIHSNERKDNYSKKTNIKKEQDTFVISLSENKKVGKTSIIVINQGDEESNILYHKLFSKYKNDKFIDISSFNIKGNSLKDLWPKTKSYKYWTQVEKIKTYPTVIITSPTTMEMARFDSISLINNEQFNCLFDRTNSAIISMKKYAEGGENGDIIYGSFNNNFLAVKENINITKLSQNVFELKTNEKILSYNDIYTKSDKINIFIVSNQGCRECVKLKRKFINDTLFKDIVNVYYYVINENTRRLSEFQQSDIYYYLRVFNNLGNANSNHIAFPEVLIFSPYGSLYKKVIGANYSEIKDAINILSEYTRINKNKYKTKEQ